MSKTFLKAEWRNLILANYDFDPEILKKYLPYKTELDFHNGICFVSLVGFKFCNTKVKGIKIPFHTNFEEVNLRFYVKYKSPEGQWRRGVVFIKEIVPKPAISFVANTLFNEKYQTMPMRHCWSSEDFMEVKYQWKFENQWNTIHVKADNGLANISPGSEEEFITEHYWGYTKVDAITTTEYEVQHPQWKLFPVLDYSIDVDCSKIYGSEFECLTKQRPLSVHLAEGSEIVVMHSGRI